MTVLPCDEVALLQQSVTKGYRSLNPFHNERVIALQDSGERVTVVFDRCMGAESGAGARIVTLVKVAGIVAPRYEVVTDQFLPTPRPVTSRKGNMVYR